MNVEDLKIGDEVEVAVPGRSVRRARFRGMSSSGLVRVQYWSERTQRWNAPYVYSSVHPTFVRRGETGAKA